MPHKKNPDVLELIRTKYHVVNSYEFQIKNMTSNLISGYHRDLQLSKEPIMNGLKITNQSLFIMSLIFKNLGVNKDACVQAMTEELYSTDEVYKLVEEGVSFREAYKIISKKY
jgi:argininosuccinate lyase